MSVKTRLAASICAIGLAFGTTAQAQDDARKNKTVLSFSAAYSELYKATLGADLTSLSAKEGGTNLSLSALRHEGGHRVNLRFGRGVNLRRPDDGPNFFYGLTLNDQNWQDSAYNTSGIAAYVGARWGLTQNNGTLTLRYSLGTSRISDVSAKTSSLVAAEEGSRTQSSLRLTYKKSLTELLDANKWVAGYSTSAELYGIGGDTKYANLTVNARLLREFASGYTVTGRLSAGTSTGLDGYVQRITERAFLSSSMPRGYAPSGIGPSDTIGTTRTGLGGLNYAAVSVELGKTLVELNQSALSGYVFADAGSVWGLSNTASSGGTLETSKHLRGSVGVGIGWQSGVGTFTISHASPLGALATDVTQPWQFEFRTDF